MPFEHLVDSGDSEERKTDELTQIAKSYNKYITVINEKLNVVYNLQKCLETKLG